MEELVSKTHEGKSRAVANTRTTNQQLSHTPVALENNRTEAVTQRKMIALLNNGQRERLIQQQMNSNVQRVSLADRKPLLSGVTQRVRLHKQQGPSCWLFVVEAVAEANGIDTSTLQLMMHSYPSSEDASIRRLQERANGNAISKRAAAVQIVYERINALHGKLVGLQGHIGVGGALSKEILIKMASRSDVTVKIADEFVWDVNDEVNIDDAIDVLHTASTKANNLANITANDQDSVGNLLNTGTTQIDPGDRKSDVHIALNQMNIDGRFPSYLSVRKRFILPQEQRQAPRADLTKRYDEDMQDTTHAVLLTAYNVNSREVTYKDPNYGDTDIIVTYKQFQKMGGDERLLIRPLITDGIARSGLATVMG